ncbi:hypothetical protein Pfo_031660, partial [Paulownia fortunei]
GTDCARARAAQAAPARASAATSVSPSGRNRHRGASSALDSARSRPLVQSCSSSAATRRAARTSARRRTGGTGRARAEGAGTTRSRGQPASAGVGTTSCAPRTGGNGGSVRRDVQRRPARGGWGTGWLGGWVAGWPGGRVAALVERAERRLGAARRAEKAARGGRVTGARRTAETVARCAETCRRGPLAVAGGPGDRRSRTGGNGGSVRRDEQRRPARGNRVTSAHRAGGKRRLGAARSAEEARSAGPRGTAADVHVEAAAHRSTGCCRGGGCGHDSGPGQRGRAEGCEAADSLGQDVAALAEREAHERPVARRALRSDERRHGGRRRPRRVRGAAGRTPGRRRTRSGAVSARTKYPPSGCITSKPDARSPPASSSCFSDSSSARCRGTPRRADGAGCDRGLEGSPVHERQVLLDRDDGLDECGCCREPADLPAGGAEGLASAGDRDPRVRCGAWWSLRCARRGSTAWRPQPSRTSAARALRVTRRRETGNARGRSRATSGEGTSTQDVSGQPADRRTDHDHTDVIDDAHGAETTSSLRGPTPRRTATPRPTRPSTATATAAMPGSRPAPTAPTTHTTGGATDRERPARAPPGRRPVRAQPVRPGSEPVRPGPVRPGPGPVRPGPVRTEPVRPGPVRPGAEPVRPEPVRPGPEPVRPEPEPVRPEPEPPVRPDPEPDPVRSGPVRPVPGPAPLRR